MPSRPCTTEISTQSSVMHIYHYYVHGAYGNNMRNQRSDNSDLNIDIQVSLLDRASRPARQLNLREIDNDMQTLYINSSVSEFEFKASKGADATVEGLLRYHPFLYDRETYPEDPYSATSAVEDDEDCIVLHAEGRGKRPIFECFWNGRLIPYSSVNEFEWCTKPKKEGALPFECYNRISGVLFTNDHFKVSTNKLTFIDLELQLCDKETIFTKVVNGQKQRVNIKNAFLNWLKDCHEQHDKQVKFLGFKGVTTRTDVQTKRQQSPWAQYESIKWGSKTYKTSQLIKTVRTVPVLYGSIIQFLLYGDHERDVFATGGYVQIALEPKVLYNEEKIIPISKIDRHAADTDIKSYVAAELTKLPDKLRVTWPEGDSWPEKAVRTAGTSIGPIKVEILNKKGETMSRLPIAGINAKKFQIDLKVCKQTSNREEIITSHNAAHSKWEYWFKKMENLTKVGKYTLHLQTTTHDGDPKWAGKPLPHYTLHFTIKEGSPVSFNLGLVPSPVKLGVPVALSLQFKDEFDHPTQPPPDLKPQIECSTLELSYEKTTTSGNNLTIKDLRARGKIKNHLDKIHTVKVVMPGLKQDFQTFQMSVLPGPPHHLLVTPEDKVIIENGTAAGFRVEVQDEFQNVTTHSRLIVHCQLLGAPGLPVDTVDCSNTGTGLLLAKPIQLKNVSTEQILTAKFNIPNQKAVPVVERTLHIFPSTRIFRLEVYREDEDSKVVLVLQNKERINWTAGDKLGDLKFRLYDEGDRMVPLTEDIAQNIKVNWAVDVKAAELAKGILPCVCVPTKAQAEQVYQVAFQDQYTVDTSFIIVPRPDEPKQLKVTLSENVVQMGETLSKDIYIEVIDQYGNRTDSLNADSMKALSVSADDLDESAINVDWQVTTGSLLVRGVRFVSGRLGSRELCFQYQDFKEFVRISVTAGPPANITLLDAPEMPLHVMNGKDLNMPFLLQLCDEWKNPIPDQRVVIVMKPLSAKLKVKSSVMSRPVDKEGKARFILETVTAQKGEHELEFFGKFSRNIIPGPVVKLNVMPDPSTPASLKVEYDTGTILRAGDTFPVFKVTLLSEEGEPIKNLSPAGLSMLLWPGVASGSCPPSETTALKCSKPKDEEDDGHFYFRDKRIPESVGKYIMQFLYTEGITKSLWSSQIALNVAANKPVKLEPETPPATPVVFNGSDPEGRTLLKRLCLKIMDKYNNPAGLGINGQVVLTVENKIKAAEDLPMFENAANSLTYNLNNGEAIITDLVLMENSPGLDGAEYVLEFNLVHEELNTTISPFTLPFRFYNDAENQKVMAVMSKKKDQLTHSIEIYKDIVKTNEQILNELQGQMLDASSKQTQLSLELRKNGIDDSTLTGISAVKTLIATKIADLERIENEPHRKCAIPDPFRGRPQVLGKVAHLAQVKDDDSAKVISWHLLGDMDCVVTVTLVAAKKIYDDTQGRQQVLSLETLFWKPNNRPLPHIRNGQCLFQPVGDPVYARDLLIFPEHAESCNMVFTVLIGDTILVNDLDSANHYRKQVVQNKMQCPTLLTRQGDRIRSNGKFGGLQNKAPPIEKLRGQVFSAPLPDEYHTIYKQKELLQQYLVAKQNASEVQAEYNTQNEYLQSPGMKQKRHELRQQEDKLKDIEKQIASTPVRPSPGSGVKRSPQDESPEPLPVKRIRES
ncbi:structural maintenance of chromosomes flexible hinge domain-containing protein 1 isoform X2 [Trichomycterus rosablanca]|uniref:structural maintenance of chromosomes flexible hinge domain-containing protein 1 isoform X2 n=1 Tax=Trichomycterus rosablanca TaxID=2290929 RepID=UPI002F35351F